MHRSGQFPLSRGSHPPPPLYPDSGSGTGAKGVLTGKLVLGAGSATETPFTVSVTDSDPNGSTVTVTVTAIGCTFADGSTSYSGSIVSGSGSIPLIAKRPVIRNAQAQIVAEFTATDRAPGVASFTVLPQPVPDPAPEHAVLASELDTGGHAQWVRTDTPTVRKIITTDEAQIGGAFGCNGATPRTPATLSGAATDLPSSLTLLNQIRALLIANGQGA